MTIAADTVALNITSEGLVFMILLSIIMKLWLLLKTYPIHDYSTKKIHPI